MTTSRDWFIGARPKTLPAAIAPVVVATAFAGNERKLIEFCLTLVVALGLQIGVNYANDYSDGIRGTDSNRIGPLRLVGSGTATATSVRRAAIISISIASIAGIALAARSNWLLLIIGAIAILAAWTYTGGPKPYGYSALGEVSVFIFFGLVATLGTYFTQRDSLTLEIFLVAVAMGLLACALLVINNLRDVDGDAASGKITLAVRLGAPRTRIMYRFALISPFALTLLLALYNILYLLPLLALPLALRPIREISRANPAGLIELLGKTSRIQLSYALLLSIAALLAER